MMSLTQAQPLARMLFSSPVVSFGLWNCPATSELWRSENLIGPMPVIALPWTGVVINRHAGRGTLVDPNSTVFYRSGEPYSRELASEFGDRCAFIQPSQELLRSALSEAGIDDDTFPFVVGPAVSWVTGAHHKLARKLTKNKSVPAIEVEDALTRIIHDAVKAASDDSRRSRPSRPAGTWRAHRDLVDQARLTLMKAIGNGSCVLRLSVADLASAVHSSPFHLCRVFKEHTGQTIAQHFMRLRLRYAAEQLSWSSQSIINTAYQFGFSSHAHFTSAWTSEFGFSPREFRRNDNMSKILKDQKGLLV